MRRVVFSVMITVLILMPLAAQDGFGFDDEAAGGSGGGSALAVSIGGEVKASMLGFYEDFADGADAVRLGDIFSARLNVSAETSHAAAFINLKLAPGLVYYDAQSPVYVDEGYLAVYFGSFDLEAGLRKLAWGKADILGPLDIINPLDYSDMSSIMDDTGALKIARPLVHISLRLGQFSKLEGVFVPGFEPVRFADSGRWAQAQMTELAAMPIPVNRPDTTTLDYAQAGLRFTTTIANTADIGAQYYYGRLTRPAVTMSFGCPRRICG